VTKTTHRTGSRAVATVLALAVGLGLAGCGAASTPTNTPASSAAWDPVLATDVTVTITGGLETDPVDNGRPVVLIAAALGVPTEVFREAFSGVTPSTDGEPTGAEAQANKDALLAVLGPHGVTNDQLDTVSNQYRYMAAAGELWPNTPATAEAIVQDGVVTGVRVLSGGAGYTSAPTITLSNGLTATAQLAYGTDVGTNGSIASIALD
jgi:hypothetical protein